MEICSYLMPDGLCCPKPDFEDSGLCLDHLLAITARLVFEHMEKAGEVYKTGDFEMWEVTGELEPLFRFVEPGETN